uniref:Uncharacterized protein n=1 Tax=Chelydra serpentina TaxID=8475 RepID=A0A8C3SKX0_CHESE
ICYHFLQLPAGQAVSSTGHPIDIVHSSLDLLSDPPTAASQAAGITGMRHHTGLSDKFCHAFTWLIDPYYFPKIIKKQKHDSMTKRKVIIFFSEFKWCSYFFL